MPLIVNTNQSPVWLPLLDGNVVNLLPLSQLAGVSRDASAVLAVVASSIEVSQSPGIQYMLSDKAVATVNTVPTGLRPQHVRHVQGRAVNLSGYKFGVYLTDDDLAKFETPAAPVASAPAAAPSAESSDEKLEPVYQVKDYTGLDGKTENVILLEMLKDAPLEFHHAQGNQSGRVAPYDKMRRGHCVRVSGVADPRLTGKDFTVYEAPRTEKDTVYLALQSR